MENTIKKTKKTLSYQKQKNIWAAIFLAPWVIGFLFLFMMPFFQSLYYSFFKLEPKVGEILTTFVGFQNYHYAINTHVAAGTSFRVEMVNVIMDVPINLFVLLIFSLFMAVLLNMEFKGRAVVRAIFFVPVILNSAAITTALGGGDIMNQILAEQGIGKIFDLEFYLLRSGLTPGIVTFIVGLLGRIYDILALAGVPILLFLASIQSIPRHLYEAAKIEGATSYEMFWLITLPNVSPHILTVVVFALVDTFLTSPVSSLISGELNTQNWGLSSAMAWIYVAVILVFLLIIGALAKIFKIGESHYEH